MGDMTEKEKAVHEEKMNKQRNVRRRVKHRRGEGEKRGVKPELIIVDKPPKNAPRRYGLLVVDIFTKYVDVIPMMNNQGDTIIEALEESFVNMGGAPKTIFSDGEGGLYTNAFAHFMKDNDIEKITTRNHAQYAE